MRLGFNHREGPVIYQVAYDEFHSGRMRWRASDATPVQPFKKGDGGN